jgi:phosphate starvation-inducible PhoH-like protein
VVRHALVQRIVRAYESAKPQQQELPLALGEAMEVGAQRREDQPVAKSVHPAKPQ